MSQIAIFTLDDGHGHREELSDGGCSGALYTIIWETFEEMGVDCRAQAALDCMALDCVRIDTALAAELLRLLPKTEEERSAWAAQIALEWAMPVEILAVGLETLAAHLRQVTEGRMLYYELI